MENLRIHPEVEALFDEMVQIRREIHMNPELLFDLPQTSSLVENFLKDLGLQVFSQVGTSGVVGVIHGEGPCLLLRADMDCLPLQETNEVPYKSLVPNRMHACGHDAHVAMLLIAAKVIAKNQSKLRGSVKFMFQPAEEGGHGAKKMIEDPKYPILDTHPRVDEVYGLHVSNNHKMGDFLLADKFLSCFTIFFAINIVAKGGHMSSDYNNPVNIASEIILVCQNIKSRNLPDSERAVFSFTSFNAGEVANAVPDSCKVQGTIRIFEKYVQDIVLERLSTILKGFEVERDCAIDLEINHLYPPIVNDKVCNEKALKILKKISPNGVRDEKSPMIGEDFSYLTELRPGNFFMMGCATDEKCNPIHSPTFDIDERAMLIGASYFVELVFDQLSNTE